MAWHCINIIKEKKFQQKRGQDFKHDTIISSYHVDLKDKTVEIRAYNKAHGKESRFLAKDVLTHSFSKILEYNIVLDIAECDMKDFINNNTISIDRMSQNGWPIDFQNDQELTEFLISNKYKYIRIRCSYGLQGWILAKDYQIN